MPEVLITTPVESPEKVIVPEELIPVAPVIAPEPLISIESVLRMFVTVPV